MTVQNLIQHENHTSLKGKVALIVGGYGAIGTTISQFLAFAGAAIIIVGRDGDKARKLASGLSNTDCSAEGLELDACDVSAVRSLTDRIAKQHGSIDILVNCIGFHKEQSLLDVTEDAFDEAYTKILRAGMFLAQAVAAHQIAKAQGGSQIHLLSVRSSLGFQNRGYSGMCATKGGLAILLKQHATELAPHGITVNGVAPGAVRTHKNDKALEDPAALQKAVANIPFGRMATPIDVAGAVMFLASSMSRFVTGQILYVDGGLTASA